MGDTPDFNAGLSQGCSWTNVHAILQSFLPLISRIIYFSQFLQGFLHNRNTDRSIN